MLIEARGITVRFGDRVVLDKVDIGVRRGEIVTLIGLNGAGKSTLVRVLLGLVAPDSGIVTRQPKLSIGFSPQHIHRDSTLPLTVERFLTLGTPNAGEGLHAVLEELGAGAIAKSQLAEISGGELNRVLLARALLRKPDLLVLDEPLGAVDVAGQSELYQLIAQIRDRYHCGVLLVSHDLHVVMAATDTVVCLNHHVCCTGHPQAIAENPAFVALFGRRVADGLAVYTHEHDHRHDAAGKEIPLELGSENPRGEHRQHSQDEA